jgi:spermidine/putrescine transport system substrate-binding protein
MKRKTQLLLGIIALFLGTSPAHAEEKVLHLYVWDTYISQGLFKKFEQETGIKILADVFDSNDALMAKLKAGGAYDVVSPSGNYVPLLIEENLLQPLPEDLKSIGAQMAPEVLQPPYDPTSSYSLPLFYGSTGLAVNTKLTQENIKSWNQYFVRPEGENATLGQLDEISSVMSIASLTLNKPYCDNNPETFKAIQSLLLNQKPFVKTYVTTGYIERLTANEVAMQVAWNGDVYKIRRENPAVQFIYPKEGVELWADNLSIPAAAKNPEGAAQFIRFVMQPEHAAAYAAEAGYMPGIATARALLPDEMKNAPEFNIPPDTKAAVTVSCPADVVRAYSRIWESLMR